MGEHLSKKVFKNNRAELDRKDEDFLRELNDHLKTFNRKLKAEFREKPSVSAARRDLDSRNMVPNSPVRSAIEAGEASLEKYVVIFEELGMGDVRNERYFSYQSGMVDSINPSTSEIESRPMVMLQRFLAVPTVVVNRGVDYQRLPSLSDLSSLSKEDKYMDSHEVALSLMKEATAKDAHHSEYHKRLADAAGYLPTPTDLTNQGINSISTASADAMGIRFAPKTAAVAGGFIAYKRGEKLSAKTWQSMTDPAGLVSSGLEEGAAGSGNAAWTAEERDAKARDRSVLLAASLPVVMAGDQSGISTWIPANPSIPGNTGYIETAFRVNQDKYNATATEEERANLVLSKTKKRSQVRNRQGQSSITGLKLDFGAIQEPSFSNARQNANPQSVIVRLFGKTVRKKVTNEITGAEEEIIEHVDDVGGGKMLGSTDFFKTKTSIALNDEPFLIEKGGINLNDFEVVAGRGHVVPSTGGTVAVMGKDRNLEEHQINYSVSGYLGGIRVKDIGMTWGNDAQSAKMIFDLIENQIPESAEQLRLLLSNPDSLEKNHPLRKRREEIEELATRRLSEIQIERKFKSTGDETQDAIQRRDLEDTYGLIRAKGIGGVRGKTAFIPVTEYVGLAQAVKGNHIKAMAGHEETEAITRQIIREEMIKAYEAKKGKGKAFQIVGGRKQLVDNVELASALDFKTINENILSRLEKETERGRYQDLSDFALQSMLGDLAKGMMIGSREEWQSEMHDYFVQGMKANYPEEQWAERERQIRSRKIELPTLPVEGISTAEIKNTPEEHINTIRMYLQAGAGDKASSETIRKLLTREQAKQFRVKEIYSAITEMMQKEAIDSGRHKSVESFMDSTKKEDFLLKAKMYAKVVELTPHYGDRPVYLTLNSHYTAEPGGTTNMVNRPSQQQLFKEAPELQEHISAKDNAAQRVINMITPGAVKDVVDISEEDIQAFKIPGSFVSEQHNRFSVVKKIYDRAAMQQGFKEKSHAAMRVKIKARNGGEDRYVHIASPYDYSDLERADTGTSLTRFFESLQNPKAPGISQQSPEELYETHLGTIREYVSSDAGQKQMQNVAGNETLSGTTFRYVTSPHAKNGTVIVGTQDLMRMAQLYGMDFKQMVRAIQSGKKLYHYVQRYPQAMNSGAFYQIDYRPGYRGAIALPKTYNHQVAGDDDGDLSNFIPGFTPFVYKRQGKNYVEFIPLPGVEKAVANQANPELTVLNRFASFHGFDALKDKIIEARGAIKKHVEDHLVGTPEFEDYLEKTYGKMDPDSDARKNALKIERDKLVVKALVNGFDHIDKTTNRAIIVRRLDVNFAGKSQAVANEVEWDDLIPTGPAYTKEDINRHVVKTLGVAPVNVTPQQAAKSSAEETEAKRGMGIYTLIKNIQQLSATDKNHIAAVERVGKNLYATKDYDNILEDLGSAVRPNNNYQASYSEQSMMNLDWGYQRALDLLKRSDAIKNMTKIYFTADTVSWGNKNDTQVDAIKNALIGMANSEEFTPLAVAAAFAERGDEQHIEFIVSEFTKLRERMKKVSGGDISKLSTEEIQAMPEFSMLMSGPKGDKHLVDANSALYQAFRWQAHINTIGKNINGSYSDSSVERRARINQNVDEEIDKITTSAEARRDWMIVAGQSREKDPAGFLADAASRAGVDQDFSFVSPRQLYEMVGYKPLSTDPENPEEIIRAMHEARYKSLFATGKSVEWEKEFSPEGGGLALIGSESEQSMYRYMWGANEKPKSGIEGDRRPFDIRASSFGSVAEYIKKGRNANKFIAGKAGDVYGPAAVSGIVEPIVLKLMGLKSLGRNQSNILSKAATVLTAGDIFEGQVKAAIEDIGGFDLDAKNFWMSPGGMVMSRKSASGSGNSGSADLFEVFNQDVEEMDPKDPLKTITVSRPHVRIFDVKKTASRSGIKKLGINIKDFDEAEERDVSIEEILNATNSGNVEVYSGQLMSYDWIAQGYEDNREELLNRVFAQKQLEEKERVRAAIASGDTTAKETIIERPSEITEKDIDFHYDSDYAKSVKSIAATMEQAYRDPKDPKKPVLDDQKKKIRQRAMEIADAFARGNVEIGGLILQNQTGVNAFGPGPIQSRDNSLVVSQFINEGFIQINKPGLGDQKGKTNALMNSLSQTVSSLIEDTGMDALGMSLLGVRLARQNYFRFRGISPETGKASASMLAQDITPLFREIAAEPGGSVVDLSSRETGATVEDSGNPDEDRTAAILATLQQATGFRASEIASMEYALRGYERKIGADGVRLGISRSGNAIVGNGLKIPKIEYSDRVTGMPEEAGDIKLREMIMSAATEAGDRGKRLRRDGYERFNGREASFLEHTAINVRDMLNPYGADETEKLARQKEALISFQEMKADYIEGIGDLMTDPTSTSESISAAFAKQFGDKYGKEMMFTNITSNPIHTGKSERITTDDGRGGTHGAIYTREREDQYDWTRNSANRSVFVGKKSFDEAESVILKSAWAIAQIKEGKKIGKIFTGNPFTGKEIVGSEALGKTYSERIANQLDPRVAEEMDRYREASSRIRNKDVFGKFSDVIAKIKDASIKRSKKRKDEYEGGETSNDLASNMEKWLSGPVTSLFGAGQGYDTFSTVPDHRRWFVSDHLKPLFKLANSIVEMGKGSGQFKGEFDWEMMSGLIMTHDLMKAKKTSRDVYLENKTAEEKKAAEARGETYTGEVYDFEADKTIAGELAIKMGFSKEKSDRLMEYLTLSDRVKKDAWHAKNRVGDLPPEVRALSTIDALSHYTRGTRGFLNIYSTETDILKTLGGTNIKDLAESNERKIKKDANKILMDIDYRYSSGGLVKREDVFSGTKLLYNTITRQTGVIGKVAGFVEQIMRLNNGTTDFQKRIFGEVSETFGKKNDLDIASGDFGFVDPKTAEITPYSTDPARKITESKPSTYTRTGKAYGGRVGNRKMDLVGELAKEGIASTGKKSMWVTSSMDLAKQKIFFGGKTHENGETVGEFGQEIISPKEDGNLYVTITSAVKRKDSEQYKSQQRIHMGLGVGRGWGGLIDPDKPAIVGEVDEENTTIDDFHNFAESLTGPFQFGNFSSLAEKVYGMNVKNPKGLNVLEWMRDLWRSEEVGGLLKQKVKMFPSTSVDQVLREQLIGKSISGEILGRDSFYDHSWKERPTRFFESPRKMDGLRWSTNRSKRFAGYQHSANFAWAMGEESWGGEPAGIVIEKDHLKNNNVDTYQIIFHEFGHFWEDFSSGYAEKRYGAFLKENSSWEEFLKNPRYPADMSSLSFFYDERLAGEKINLEDWEIPVLYSRNSMANTLKSESFADNFASESLGIAHQMGLITKDQLKAHESRMIFNAIKYEFNWEQSEQNPKNEHPIITTKTVVENGEDVETPIWLTKGGKWWTAKAYGGLVKEGKNYTAGEIGKEKIASYFGPPDISSIPSGPPPLKPINKIKVSANDIENDQFEYEWRYANEEGHKNFNPNIRLGYGSTDSEKLLGITATNLLYPRRKGYYDFLRFGQKPNDLSRLPPGTSDFPIDTRPLFVKRWYDDTKYVATEGNPWQKDIFKTTEKYFGIGYLSRLSSIEIGGDDPENAYFQPKRYGFLSAFKNIFGKRGEIKIGLGVSEGVEGLATLFHEIGHYDETLRANKFRPVEKRNTYQSLMKSEVYASMFALKHLRRVLPKESIAAAEQSLLSALTTYEIGNAPHVINSFARAEGGPVEEGKNYVAGEVGKEGWKRQGLNVAPLGRLMTEAERRLNVRADVEGVTTTDEWSQKIGGDKKIKEDPMEIAKRYFGEKFLSGVDIGYVDKISRGVGGMEAAGVFSPPFGRKKPTIKILDYGKEKTFYDLYTIFHETGHYASWLKNGTKGIRYPEYEDTMHEESLADRFALKHLRKLLNDKDFAVAQQSGLWSLYHYERFSAANLPDEVYKEERLTSVYFDKRSPRFELKYGEDKYDRKYVNTPVFGWRPNTYVDFLSPKELEVLYHGFDHEFITKSQLEKVGIEPRSNARAEGGPVEEGKNYVAGEFSEEKIIDLEKEYWTRFNKTTGEMPFVFGGMRSDAEKMLKVPALDTTDYGDYNDHSNSKATKWAIAKATDALRRKVSFDPVEKIKQMFGGRQTEHLEWNYHFDGKDKHGNQLEGIDKASSFYRPPQALWAASYPVFRGYGMTGRLQSDPPAIYISKADRHNTVLGAAVTFHEFGHYFEDFEAEFQSKNTIPRNNRENTLKSEVYASISAMRNLSKVLDKDDLHSAKQLLLSYLTAYERRGLAEETGLWKPDNKLTAKAYGGLVDHKHSYVTGEHNEEEFSYEELVERLKTQNGEKIKKSTEGIFSQTLAAHAGGQNFKFGDYESLSEKLLGFKAVYEPFEFEGALNHFRSFAVAFSRATRDVYQEPFTKYKTLQDLLGAFNERNLSVSHEENNSDFNARYKNPLGFWSRLVTNGLDSNQAKAKIRKALDEGKIDKMFDDPVFKPWEPSIIMHVPKILSVGDVATFFHESGHYDEDRNAGFLANNRIERGDRIGIIHSETYANNSAFENLPNVLNAKQYELARNYLLLNQLTYEAHSSLDDSERNRKHFSSGRAEGGPVDSGNSVFVGEREKEIWSAWKAITQNGRFPGLSVRRPLGGKNDNRFGDPSWSHGTSLRGYRITTNSNQTEESAGWKIHLASEEKNYEDVDKWLFSQAPYDYKLLAGGTPQESDFTVYVGRKKQALDLAEKIRNGLSGKLLFPKAAATKDSVDLLVNDKVSMRFDPLHLPGYGGMSAWENTVFYGRQGVPYDEIGNLLTSSYTKAKLIKSNYEKRGDEKAAFEAKNRMDDLREKIEIYHKSRVNQLEEMHPGIFTAESDGRANGGVVAENYGTIVGRIDRITFEDKWFGGKLGQNNTRNKETVGEFGQEIISPREDGNLYVTPTSAVKRKDSESYRAQSRFKIGKWIGRATPGPVGTAGGTAAGEAGVETFDTGGAFGGGAPIPSSGRRGIGGFLRSLFGRPSAEESDPAEPPPAAHDPADDTIDFLRATSRGGGGPAPDFAARRLEFSARLADALRGVDPTGIHFATRMFEFDESHREGGEGVHAGGGAAGGTRRAPRWRHNQEAMGTLFGDFHAAEGGTPAYFGRRRMTDDRGNLNLNWNDRVLGELMRGNRLGTAEMNGINSLQDIQIRGVRATQEHFDNAIGFLQEEIASPRMDPASAVGQGVIETLNSVRAMQRARFHMGGRLTGGTASNTPFNEVISGVQEHHEELTALRDNRLTIASRNFTNALVKGTETLVHLTENMDGMVRTTRDADRAFRKISDDAQTLRGQIDSVRGTAYGHTEAGARWISEAESVHTSLIGQLRRGSDLHSRATEVGGSTFADNLSDRFGDKDGRDKERSRRSVITAHFLNEAVRSMDHVIQPRLHSQAQYSAMESREKTLLVPTMQALDKNYYTGAIAEGVREDWNYRIGQNAANVIAMGRNIDPNVMSGLRFANQIGQSAFSAASFVANLAPVIPGIGVRHIAGAAIAAASADTIIQSFAASGNPQTMGDADAAATAGGSVWAQDVTSGLGYYVGRPARNFFNTAREWLGNYQGNFTPDAIANQLGREIGQRAFQRNQSQQKINAVSQIERADLVGRRDALNAEQRNYLSRLQENGGNPGAMPSLMARDFDQYASTIELYREFSDAGFVNPSTVTQEQVTGVLTSRRNAAQNTIDRLDGRQVGIGPEIVRDANGQQITDLAGISLRQAELVVGPYRERMADFDPNIPFSEQNKTRNFSPIQNLAFSRPQYSAAWTAPSEYVNLLDRHGFSFDQKRQVFQYSQIVAGDPNTAAYSQAFTGFTTRSAQGENLDESWALARQIGANTGDYSLYSGTDYLLNRNWANGALLSQAELYGTEANTKNMHVSDIAKMVSMSTGADFKSIVKNMQSNFVGDAMTPDAAEFASQLELFKQGMSASTDNYNKNNPNEKIQSIDIEKWVKGEYTRKLDKQGPDSIWWQNGLLIPYDQDPRQFAINSGGVSRDVIDSATRKGYITTEAAAKAAKAFDGESVYVAKNLEDLGLNEDLRSTIIENGGDYGGSILLGLSHGDPIAGAAFAYTFNSLAPETRAQFATSSGFGISYDPTTNSRAGTKSMFGLMVKTSEAAEYKASSGYDYLTSYGKDIKRPANFERIVTPTFNRAKGIEAYRKEAAAQRPNIIKYFDANNALQLKSGLQTAWTSKNEAQRQYYGKIFSGESVEVMVGGVPTPLAGPEAMEYVASQKSAMSQLASAAASYNNLKLQRQFELDWDRPNQEYQRQQHIAQVFGGSVASPFSKFKDLRSNQNLSREDREGVDVNAPAQMNFGRGTLEYQRLERNIQLRDMQANFSNNMTRMSWQAQDFDKERKRQLVHTGYQQEDIQMQRSSTLLNRGMQMFNFGFEAREMSIGKQSYREDYAYNKRMKQLQFGWQMEDADINIRRATGFERRQLIKNKERETIAFNEESGQNEKVNKRQEEAFKRQEEKFKKEIDHYKKSISLEDQQYKNTVKRLETQQEWDKEDYEIKRHRLSQEQAWAEESFGRQMEKYALEQEQFELRKNNEEVLAADQQKYQEAAWELGDKIYKNNLAAASSALDAADHAATAAGLMKGIAADFEKGAEAMDKFTNFKWDQMAEAMDKTATVLRIALGLPEPAKTTTTTTTKWPDATAKARGGPINAGGTYLVGEIGPEIITTDSHGRPYVIPNSALPKGRLSSGAGDGVIHIHVMMDSNEIATYTSDKANNLASRNRRRAFNG